MNRRFIKIFNLCNFLWIRSCLFELGFCIGVRGVQPIVIWIGLSFISYFPFDSQQYESSVGDILICSRCLLQVFRVLVVWAARWRYFNFLDGIPVDAPDYRLAVNIACTVSLKVHWVNKTKAVSFNKQEPGWLTALSSVLMHASNSSSPTFHFLCSFEIVNSLNCLASENTFFCSSLNTFTRSRLPPHEPSTRDCISHAHTQFSIKCQASSIVSPHASTP